MRKSPLLFLPANLDFKSLTIDKPIYLLKKDEDKFRLLLTLSHIIRIMSKKAVTDYGSEYVQIKMEYLRIYVLKADLYVKRLIEMGIIECDSKYLIGLKSKGYRLRYPYNSSPQVVISSNNQFNTFNKKAFIASFDSDSKELRPLYKHFNDDLEIDYKSALKDGFCEYWRHNGEELPIFIDDIDFEKINGTGIFKRGQEFSSLEHRKAYHKFINGVVIPISMIHMKQFYFSVDKSGYRLHTNLTNLNKEQRKHLSYRGERLVAWDLKNSQPFFLNVLLSSRFWDSRNEVLGYKSLRGELKSIQRLKLRGIDPSITMVEMHEIQSSEAFKDFKKATLEGNLYEKIQSFSVQYFDKELSREQAKLEFIRILFDKPCSKRNYHFDTDASMIMGFPGVLQFLDNTFKQKQYNTLALLLQQIESNVILRNVCPAIAKKYPEIPLFTVHDSIVTTEGNEELIKPIIEKEIQRLTEGLTPKLKLEKWF